ncbi:PREDICTED: uncharacterized protein LOC106743710 [Dinoponera quadriceps]|uniref:Uncharacterized protein LOC106743710 n=1 Tax=Dinoponera quadriceps TaxID=609295 RepID=A0A6P3X4Y2_DINQU|nr:PREDICTED: uncharacterized protein LOC106743710 [Dinoponera quadriceps]
MLVQKLRCEHISRLTVDQVAVESEVEEIAAGIDRAITLAQDLRESVKLNVAPPRKPSRKGPIGKASPSAPASNNGGRRDMPRTNVATQRTNVAKNAGVRSPSTVFQSGAVTSIASRNTNDKRQWRASAARSSAKSKNERNFILENKLNVKKITPPNKSQAGTHGSNCISQTSKRSLPPAALAPELSNLIHKMAQKFTESALVSSPDDGRTNNCPLHDGNQLVERTIMVDAAEALRHFSVPNEIVRALRTSHIFFKKTDANRSNVTGEVRAKSIDNFLKEFDTMNTSVQDDSEEISQLIKMAHESMTFFSDIFTGKLDSTQLDEVQNWITNSKVVLKPCNTEKIVEDRIIERASFELPLTKEWMLNGVWNISCMKHFKSFPEVYCMRYNDERQLLSLYEAVQKLQRAEYLNTLIQTILCDVIPAIRSNIDPASAEYARAYKTIFILSQGLNPEVPVLVRTDS